MATPQQHVLRTLYREGMEPSPRTTIQDMATALRATSARERPSLLRWYIDRAIWAVEHTPTRSSSRDTYGPQRLVFEVETLCETIVLLSVVVVEKRAVDQDSSEMEEYLCRACELLRGSVVTLLT